MKKANSKLKIVTTKIAMVSIIVFPLVALMHATFAWFLAQRNVNNGINGIVATLPNKVIDKLYVFQEKRTENATNYRQYDPEAKAVFDVNKNQWIEGGSIEDKLGLGTYSSLYPFHSSLMVLKVNESATSEDINKFSLNIVTGTSYKQSLVFRNTSGDNTPERKLKKDGNPLSSIVTFNYASTNNKMLNIDGTLNEGYRYFNSKYNNQDQLELDGMPFINKAFYKMNDNKDGVGETNYSKIISIVDTKNQSIITQNNKYVVIMVEYFNEGLQYIYSLNIGNDVLSGGTSSQALSENSISFICDWSIVGQ